MAAEVADILRRIVARRRERMTEPVERSRSTSAGPRAGFVDSLTRHAGRRIIAEVKMGSPRIGSLVDRVDPEAQAAIYAREGAAALSVVVEPDFFHGSYELLTRCTRASGLPAIAKDFVVDERQLHWAKHAGASAVLLIAALHSSEDLERYAALAGDLDLDVLLETHGIDDLVKLSDREWPLVGVNNRDLRTFEVDLEHSRRLVTRLPAAALKVSESGLGDALSLSHLETVGFDAFLIGESLLLADDPASKLRHLLTG